MTPGEKLLCDLLRQIAGPRDTREPAKVYSAERQVPFGSAYDQRALHDSLLLELVLLASDWLTGPERNRVRIAVFEDVKPDDSRDLWRFRCRLGIWLKLPDETAEEKGRK